MLDQLRVPLCLTGTVGLASPVKLGIRKITFRITTSPVSSLGQAMSTSSPIAESMVESNALETMCQITTLNKQHRAFGFFHTLLLLRLFLNYKYFPHQVWCKCLNSSLGETCVTLFTLQIYFIWFELHLVATHLDSNLAITATCVDM